MGKILAKGVLIVSLLAGVPACGGGSSSSGVAGPTILFSDSFAVFPSAAWSVTTAPVIQDNSTGAPAPSVKIGPNQANMQSSTGFANHSITFSCDFAMSASNNGTIALTGPGGDVRAEILLTQITYTVNGVSSTVPTSNDSQLHHYVFTINAAGFVAITRDGLAVFASSNFIPVTPSLLFVRFDGNTCWADNVLVTTP